MDEYKSDIELFNEMAQDNVGSFREIYYRYSKKMFIYILSVLKKKEICEDIVQNIFTDFWFRRKSIQLRNVKSYLFQAVKYQIFNHFRNKKMSEEELTKLDIIDTSMNISQKMECNDLEELISIQVSKLPSRCQEIFILSRFEHKPNKIIAQELGISIQAVKNQISKALRTIRKNLVHEGLILCLLFLDSMG